MKKIVSIFLCAFLLLALLPAGALAAENQLYFKRGENYDTFLGLPYGDTNLVTFSIDDGQGGKTDLDGSYTVGAPGMGSFSWVANGNVRGFHWDTTQNGGMPGNEGVVFAQKQDGPCYQIDCRINAPVVGVYLDEAGTQFCPGGKVAYTPGTAKTVWLKAGDGFTFAAAPTGNPDTVTVEKISDTLVKLTLASTAAGTVNANLNCSISPGGEPFNRVCTVIFAEKLTEGLYLYDGNSYFRAKDMQINGKTAQFTSDLFYCNAEGQVSRMTETPAGAEIGCGGVIASVEAFEVPENGYKTWNFVLKDEGWNGNTGTGTVTLTPASGTASTVTFNFSLPEPTFGQLYFLGMNGVESGIGRPYGDMSMWKLAVPDGQGGFIELDNGWNVWTDEGLGAFISQGPDGFLWDTNMGVPGTSGYVYARQGENGLIYRMNATINAPMIGIYSAQPTENPAENLCPGGTVRYVTGESAVAYLKLGWDTIDGEITSQNDKISAVKISDSVAEITLTAGCSGSVSAELLVPTSDATRRITVTFIDAEPLFYGDFSDPEHPVYSDSLSGVQGGGMPLNLFVNRGNGMEMLGEGFTVTATRGQIVYDGPVMIWGIPSDTNPGFGTITAVKNDEIYRMQIAVGVPQHPAVSAEVLPAALEEGLYTNEYKDLDPDRIQPVEFQFDGGTYYMAAGALSGMGPGGPITWGSLNPEDYVTTEGTVGVDFYTFDAGSGYTPVSAELRAQLTAAFNGSLTLTMYTETEGQIYPAMFPSALDYACARTYIYDGSVRGRMFFVAEGTVDGETIHSLGMFEYNPRHVEEKHCTTVEEINAYFAEVMASDAPNAMYKVFVDTDALEGTIVVPVSYVNADAYIYGNNYDALTGPSGTTLTGSIDADGHLFLYGMNLVGKGKDVEEDNAGLTGDGIVQYFNCSFTGFYHAVETVRGLRFGGTNCTFRNNHVGIYINMDPHYSDGGNSRMFRFVFEENDIAIQCIRFSTNVPMYEFKIEQSSFLENLQDIVNTSGRYLFVPGNYFEHADQAQSGKTMNDYSEGTVSIYPIATNQQFNDFDYSGTIVQVSNSLAGSFRIPGAALAGIQMGVFDNGLEDTKLGTWSFGGDAE